MLVLLTVALLAQPATCGDAAGLAAARARVAALDLNGALSSLEQASAGCPDAQVSLWYLRGLAAAREAYRDGGSAESLAPVRRAIEALRANGPRVETSEIAVFVLQAAAAAAQSEREEMALLLDQAQLVEGRLSDAAVPLVLGVADVAGDLWLQVHRFEDARRAYREAARLRGPSARVALGLARVAGRTNDVTGACEAYQDVVAMASTGREAPEVVEARSFLGGADCRARPARP